MNKHINKRHKALKNERARWSPAQVTYRVIWEKVFRRSRAGVEHYTYKPLLIKA